MPGPTHFHCGEALCKRPIEIDVSEPVKWPVRCPACRVSLYPRDVINSIPLDGLAPNRSVLKKNVAGKLVEAMSKDLEGGGALAGKRGLLAGAAILILVGAAILAFFLLR